MVNRNRLPARKCFYLQTPLGTYLLQLEQIDFHYFVYAWLNHQLARLKIIHNTRKTGDSRAGMKIDDPTLWYSTFFGTERSLEAIGATLRWRKV